MRFKLSELEKVGKIKVKIVERSGTKLQELLHKSNVWEERDCLRDDCWVCTEENLGGKKGQCYKKNITYETYCITCYKEEERERLERERKDKGAEPSSQYGENGMVKEKGVDRENVGGYGSMIGAEPSSKYGQKGMVKEKYNEKKEKKKDGKENSKKEKMEFKVKYIGESSRSLYERSREHKEDYKNHYLACHRDIKREEMEFGVRVRKKFVKSFERQVGEAIAIEQEQMKGTVLLNSKSEFNRCSVPRLTLGTYKDNLEEIKKEEKEEKHLKEEIRKLRKRKPEEEGDLLTVCNEIISENYLPWKKRRIQEEIVKEKVERKEEEDWERTKRLNRARWKKKDLIEQIEKKKKEGKPIEWIQKKQKLWRRYRERISITEAEKIEIQKRII